LPEGEGWEVFPGALAGFVVYETISALAEPGNRCTKTYVTGVSRGGMEPGNLFVAVTICCRCYASLRRRDPALASKIVNMPIWAFHGANDKNVPVSGSRDMISAIKRPADTRDIRNTLMERTTFGTI